MRQFTIAERLIAVVLPPLVAMLTMPYLSAALAPLIGIAAVVLTGAVVLETVRTLTEAADTLDAIAHAELHSATHRRHRETCRGAWRTPTPRISP